MFGVNKNLLKVLFHLVLLDMRWLWLSTISYIQHTLGE